MSEQEQVVAAFLSELALTSDEKVYHSGPQSFTWAELSSEVSAGTEFGQWYAQSLKNRAVAEGKSLEEFLNPET